MNGYVIAGKIKNDPKFKESEVVMLTSVGLRGDAAKCREIGISAYLTKPIKRSDLLHAIKLMMGSREVQQENQPLLTAHFIRESRNALTVLVAEDNLVNQTLARRLLEKRGHTVVVAETGKAAVAAVEKQTFDLVLMDVQMPEMDGIEATAAIRERERSDREASPNHCHDCQCDDRRQRTLSSNRHGRVCGQASVGQGTLRSYRSPFVPISGRLC